MIQMIIYYSYAFCVIILKIFQNKIFSKISKYWNHKNGIKNDHKICMGFRFLNCAYLTHKAHSRRRNEQFNYYFQSGHSETMLEPKFVIFQIFFPSHILTLLVFAKMWYHCCFSDSRNLLSWRSLYPTHFIHGSWRQQPTNHSWKAMEGWRWRKAPTKLF